MQRHKIGQHTVRCDYMILISIKTNAPASSYQICLLVCHLKMCGTREKEKMTVVLWEIAMVLDN